MNRTRTVRVLFGLATTAVLACGAARAQGQPVTGTWDVTIQGSGFVYGIGGSATQQAPGSTACAPECRWEGQLTLQEDPDGDLTGSLTATLVEGGACPCPESVTGSIEGERDGDWIEFELESDDYLFDHALFEGEIESPTLISGDWESYAEEFGGTWEARLRQAPSPVPVMGGAALAGLGALLALGGLALLRRHPRQ